jgi:anti-sigma B factor antagonist
VAPDRGISAGVRTGEIALERNDSGLTVLTISGEHDLSTAPDLRRQLDGLIADRTPVVIDLSPASFVDSSILGVILDGKRRANDAGLGYAVLHSNGTSSVSRVLDVTGLRTELPVHRERQHAASAAESSGESKS